jgi:hypothetical protein
MAACQYQNFLKSQFVFLLSPLSLNNKKTNWDFKKALVIFIAIKYEAPLFYMIHENNKNM